MLKRIAFALLFCALASSACAQLSLAKELVLVENGASEYKIVVADDAPPVQKTAASELQTYVQKATGAELPIVAASEVESTPDSKLLILGPSALSQDALWNVSEAKAPRDGLILKACGARVVFSGSPERGPLYAVYEFLERFLGVRWYSSTVEVVPQTATLAIPSDLLLRDAPKFVYRESFYRDAFNSPFAARLRCNGDTERIPPEYGGKNNFLYGCHSSFTIIPPKTYFREHPDWFAEIDGVRRVGAPFCWGMEDQLGPGQAYGRGTQLCFSNDEMVDEMIANIRKDLRANPDVTFVDVSQNDCEGYCQCEKCRAIDEEEGSHCGALLRAVNKIAEALGPEFPNVYFETLAYTYTRKPPKVTKPRENVVIRLCSIECSFAQPLDSDANADFRDDLLGWSKICDKLFVWDYATDFAYYVLPFPNYHVLAPNIKFYAQHNVLGMLEQGDYQSPTGDFVELRAWIVAKLLWNPNADVRKLFKDFVSGYYAPELFPVYWEYFQLLSQAVQDKDFKLTIYLMTTRDWLDTNTLVRATALQDEALRIAKELADKDPEKYPELVDRVIRGRLPLDAVWAQEYRRAYVECLLRGFTFNGPDDPVQMCKDYLQKLDDYGFVKRRENEPGEMYPDFRKATLAEYDAWRTPLATKPSVCKRMADNAWLDVQEIDLVQEEGGAAIEENAEASNGYEVKIPSGVTASWNVPSEFALFDPENKPCELCVYAQPAGASVCAKIVGPEDGAETALEGVEQDGVVRLRGAKLAPGAKICVEAQGGDLRVDRIVLLR